MPYKAVLGSYIVDIHLLEALLPSNECGVFFHAVLIFFFLVQPLKSLCLFLFMYQFD